MKPKVVTTILALFLVGLITSTATRVLAQTGGGGSIQGTVTDPTGAVVAGATVVATNVATKVETTRQTNDAGLYVMSPVPPGEYRLVVTTTGFLTLIQEKIIVDALSTVSVNLTLKVGDVKETVTVADAPAQLNTSDARLGTTVRNELYTALPLAMGTAVAGSGIGQGPRNPGAFIFLLPGVTEGNGTRWGNINGGQGFSKDVFVEGVPITDPIQQGEGRTVSLGLSVEAVEQFQVETSGTGVEFNGQGSENYTLKSGKNQFHGSGFEYLRNTILDAKGFFPAIRPIEHQHEFGLTIGGPIVKKKLFFFFSFDGWRYRVVSPTLLVSVPTLKERTGDFTELGVNIYDPLSTVCVGNACTRTQFADPTRATATNPLGLNIIPANRLSAVSKVYQSFLPLPTNTGVTNNYLGQVPVGYDNKSYNLKVDYDLTGTQRLSGIYMHGIRSQSGAYREVSAGDPGSVLPLPYTSTRLVTEIPTVFQLKHTWSITPNLINQASFGFQHLFVPITNATSADKWSSKSGLQGLPAGDAADAFLEASFGGTNAPTGWRGTNARDFEDNNYNFTFQDAVLYVKGKHSFKFGGQYQSTYDKVKTDDTGTFFNAAFLANQTGQFTTGTSSLISTTGNSYASYLLGAVSTSVINDDTVSGNTPTIAQFKTYSWWVADDFHATKRLTLNLGLRHDIMLPYREANDKFTFMDPNAPNPAAGGIGGALRFGGNYAPAAISCNCRTIVKTDYKAFGPRVGFAYAFNDKTVFRGGYGIMYTRRGAVGGREGARQGTLFVGINASPALAAVNAYDPAYYFQNGVPAYIKGPIYDETYLSGFATGRAAGGGMNYGNPDSVPPRYTNWNLSVQRSITSSLVLTAAYVGGLGTSLAGAAPGRWTDQTPPAYLALGSLLNSTATPANVAAAAAIIPGIKLPFATYSGTIAQMLKPFPQYASVAAPYNNDGMSNYQALQFSIQQRLSRGLTFNLNYTYSKSLGTVNGFQTAYQSIKALSVNDEPHVVNAFYSYQLPFGKARIFNPENKVIRSIASGWTISGISRFASGVPLGPFTVNCSAGQPGTCYANYNPAFTGSPRINGDWGNGNVNTTVASATPFINVAAFTAPAAYTYGNTTPTGAYGLRQPHFLNQDLSITRNFQIRENLKFVFGADAYNLFNTVRFGGIGTAIGNIAAPNAAFGKPTTQTNLPRAFQFKFRLEF
jgi:hypothetical protein